MSDPAVLERFERSRVLFRSLVGRPEPDNLYDRQAWNMGGVHLMLTESMLSVYRQAEGIKPADEAAFAFYALITMGGVHHHHMTEEEKYLPALEPEFKTPIVDEHHLFTGPLHELEEYLQELTGLEPDAAKGQYVPAKNPKPKVAYNGRKITEAIERMAEPMFTHLEKEIEYLAGDKLRECGLPLSKLEAWAVYEKSMIKNFDPWVSLVFVVAHTPRNSQFPPLPPGIRSFLVPWVFWWKHRKSWRFCPPQEPLKSA
ncbi:hypothetical protein M408DRAFT_210589 [Serendipita vermifera MAFF 305830]|uniref:Hemerythrin-like domain-containing protein n=1 Tax=Serendipita vermifera MAFF 305830 TaxID=933852 RepID=A0A0C3AZL0_SERVB|nr:hypothetical protein M408DRAFT_210589 [Serendipita vermifera MAFF 305830]